MNLTFSSFLKISILSLAVVLSGCESEFAPKNVIKIGGKTMGTFYTITVVGDYPGGQDQLKNDAEQILGVINKEISIFDKNSILSKFNESKSTEPFEITRDMADIITTSINVGYDVEGIMDVTVGPLVNLWGFGNKKDLSKKEPTLEEINEAKKYVGADKIHVTYSYGKYFLKKDHPDVFIDLATVGEGFGADKLSQLLDKKGIKNYMVAIAGAIRTRGSNARGTDWVIAIEDPANEQRVGESIEVPVCTKGKAISTAGSYRNFIESNGKRKSHAIDPFKGEPIDHETVSVTVVGPTALWTDALDTGLLIWGADKALRYANENGIAIYTIVKDGNGFKSRYSRAMQEYLICE